MTYKEPVLLLHQTPASESPSSPEMEDEMSMGPASNQQKFQKEKARLSFRQGMGLGLKINCVRSRVRRSNSCGNLSLLTNLKTNDSYRQSSITQNTSTVITPPDTPTDFGSSSLSRSHFNFTFPLPKSIKASKLAELNDVHPSPKPCRKMSKTESFQQENKRVQWASTDSIQVYTYASEKKYYKRSIFYGYGPQEPDHPDQSWCVNGKILSLQEYENMS